MEQSKIRSRDSSDKKIFEAKNQSPKSEYNEIALGSLPLLKLNGQVFCQSEERVFDLNLCKALSIFAFQLS